MHTQRQRSLREGSLLRVGMVIGMAALAAVALPLFAQTAAVSPGGPSAPASTVRPIVKQQLTVTTTRSLVDVGPTANTTATLSADDLTEYPALTLDERLRQHAGFELFRRSSTWVANPTSEGISLRGLGSTAASRTLVLSSGVPLNDPFGGWVHWDEMPPETIEDITLASGGGSDLYGSSALGGVIDILPARPESILAAVDLAGASQDTINFSGRADRRLGDWGALAAAEVFQTEGYIVVAPAVRGLVDIPSNVHFENGRIEIDRALPSSGRAFLTGNVLNEARSNGTPLQTNGTRFWRYIAGDDWTANARTSGRVRAFGSNEAYRQNYSNVASVNGAPRAAETITDRQHIGIQEFGASADASFHMTHVGLVAGGDLRDIRARNFEAKYTTGNPSSNLDISARQRFYGGFGEILAEHGRWSGSASLRADEAANLTTRTITQGIVKNVLQAPVPAPLADRHEVVFSPRVGLVRQLPWGVALHVAGFRAFRTPTMNELYRSSQVGAQLTLPNSSLLSERATGAEGGATWSSKGNEYAGQATYFWTEINRPVAAVQQGASNTYLRQNLGQIQSQGMELATQIAPARTLGINFGYVYAHAVVTAYTPQPGQISLVGNWIPEVPRHSATAQVRYRPTSSATLTVAAREIGHVFDDSSNTYSNRLHCFFVLDIHAEDRINRYVTAYVSFQNLLDRSIDASRTPNLTLGTPLTAQGGVRLTFGPR